MMLHEAVMLEIYRQALNASELASPRCQSRESIVSAAAGDGRCPSNESHGSGNDSTTPAATPTTSSPPVGLPLPASLAPAAAAALLPPQSAAMAAYLNAAAAAAQQNHLLLTNPLAAAASLVQQATQSQSHSPGTTNLLAATHGMSSPLHSDAPDVSALDFSTKRRISGHGCSDEEDADEAKHCNDADNGGDNSVDVMTDDANSPLDLTVNTGRKRTSDDDKLFLSTHKISRISDYKSVASDTWVPPMNPYLAAVAAATLSPKTPMALDWNLKQKISPNEATKALEKMTEMTRLGASADKDVVPSMRSLPASHTSSNAGNNNSSNGRHSAWQSHWLNKGADAAKDVFKCVWCKQSFPTLASLTTHMKETQHCGVNVPPSVAGAGASLSSNSGLNHTTASASPHSRHSTTHASHAMANSCSPSPTAGNASTISNKSDLNLLIKETMPLPRKLVRGQDVWLGKGAEQTRQILKCMWCGQSFRSLAEMTSHMQETQHYTNIISQEQIISWKSSDDKSSSERCGGSSNGPATSPAVASSPNANPTTTALSSELANISSIANAAANTNATVSAVLTCKVCDQAFPSLKELSNHMVKNAHYKEHMLRSATGDSNAAVMPRRGRQTREKRKKSLPVRKLLELERAQQDYKSSNSNNSLDTALKPLRDFAASTKITCEKCGDKIETAVFVDHIRQCLGGNIPMSPRNNNNNNSNYNHNNNNNNHHHHNNNNNNLKPPYPIPLDAERLTSPQSNAANRDERKSSNENISTLSARPDMPYTLPKDGDKTSSTPSVLNAIEQLIEKSFETRPRPGALGGAGSGHMGTHLGSSILKRLGIDDSVDYTKPLMDSQTMHFLRTYSGFSGRDRSASESSSVSERCSSRLESVTPERNSEISRHATPRLTPEKTAGLPETLLINRELSASPAKVKSEPVDDSEARKVERHNRLSDVPTQKISVKKEFSMADDGEALPTKKIANNEADMRRHALTPNSRAISPAVSERSITPKSTNSLSDKKQSIPVASSLNALSSMFDNLNNMNCVSAAGSSHCLNETNNNTTVPAKKTNSNPLAALQKLCETTDPPATNTRSNNNNNNNNVSNNLQAHTVSATNTASHAATNNSGGGNSSMVAFSWACNDAVMTAADSIIKCSLCDTPFCSKGAYRHHLSKVHFLRDNDTDSQCSSIIAMKSPPVQGTSPKPFSSPRSYTKSPATQRQAASPATMTALTPITPMTPTINLYDESAESKFLKYTELAKQLSSKNV